MNRPPDYLELPQWNERGIPPSRMSNRSLRSERSYLDGPDNEFHKDVSARQVGYLSGALLISYLLVLFAIATAVLASIVFIKTRHKTGSLLSNQSIHLFSDSCDSSLHLYNLLGHFIINFLGTIVLASSNFLQQICSSPSITEIADRIHAGKDLKFGSNSPAAVFRQKTSLSLLWLSLVLTSLPLHIMINGIMGYAVNSIDAGCQAFYGPSNFTAPRGNWTTLSSDQCASLLQQSVAYVTNFQNITIVVNSNAAAPLQFYDQYMNPSDQETERYVAEASDIATCFVDYVDSECQLTVRWFPLVISASALIIKALIAFIGLHRHSHFRRRIFNSLGDMIAVGARHPHLRMYAPEGIMFGRQPCRVLHIPWRKALGFWDFLVAVFWWVSALGVVTFGVWEWVMVGQGMSWGDRWKRFGFGNIDPATSIVPGSADYQEGTPNTFPLQVIIANLPQLWLSIGYLLWNNQISRIWLEREWRGFYNKRKLPRVSYDTGTSKEEVHATRWLQLPYWLTFLLIALNTVLHWLVSQTLFVVEILPSATKPANFYLNFSPLAIVCIGVASTILILAMTIYYFVPIETWMPLMAGSVQIVLESCSRLEAQLPKGGVMWGDISTRERRLAGFGPMADLLVPGAVYPGDRSMEPEHLRKRGSVLSFASASGSSDMTAPLLRGSYPYG
jgi:hypothetical protein